MFPFPNVPGRFLLIFLFTFPYGYETQVKPSQKWKMLSSGVLPCSAFPAPLIIMYCQVTQHLISACYLCLGLEPLFEGQVHLFPTPHS